MTEASVRIGILGGSGRMARMLIAQTLGTAGARLAAAAGVPEDPARGRDLGELAGLGPCGIALGADWDGLLDAAQVVIDFTTPAVSAAFAVRAAARGVALVVGTTGLGAPEHAALDAAATRIPVMQAPNMSVGVVLLTALVEQAAARLGSDYDIEIVEMHHRHKVDAPSGTALALGEAAARGRAQPLADLRLAPHDGITGPRTVGGIGFAVLRGGDVAGDHQVTFAAEGERIELGHRASNRQVFAAGALRAALWLAGRPAGRYDMRHVLGLVPAA